MYYHRSSHHSGLKRVSSEQLRSPLTTSISININIDLRACTSRYIFLRSWSRRISLPHGSNGSLRAIVTSIIISWLIYAARLSPNDRLSRRMEPTTFDGFHSSALHKPSYLTTQQPPTTNHNLSIHFKSHIAYTIQNGPRRKDRSHAASPPASRSAKRPLPRRRK